MRRFPASTSSSASASKSRFTAIALHPVPAHQSTKEFAARIEALADARVALPVAQKTLLKYEIVAVALTMSSIIADDPEHWRGHPDPSRRRSESQPPTIFKCQTAEDFQVFLKDKKVAQSISAAAQDSQVAGPAMFSTDVVTRIDDDSKNKTTADVVT
ncbi:hypothetical protein DFH06DRAFT_1145942 [Mycena polygramma]|nr:hypothetical protein DFH06DRAFT_1145942 [Mycena polygramma]